MYSIDRPTKQYLSLHKWTNVVLITLQTDPALLTDPVGSKGPIPDPILTIMIDKVTHENTAW